MKKIVRIKESKLKQIVENKILQLLNEELGSNMDVNTLSEFILNFLENKGFGKYTLNKNQLPQLRKINMNKIIIDYNNTTSSSYFDVYNSKITNQGSILYFNFNKDNLSEDVHHEINHALQFFVLGKEQAERTLDYMKISYIVSSFTKKNIDIVNRFNTMLYRSNEQEINAQISGTYGKLMTHLKKQGWKKGMFKNDNNFSKWFVDYIKTTSSYLSVINMKNYNIFKEFNINNLKHVKEYDKRVYFTMVKIMIENEEYSPKKIILTSEQVNSLMKKYQIYINKQGEKLRRKLFRLYDLFI